MLEVKNITGGYINIPVVKDVSFTVESGQLVGLIGLNGAGKINDDKGNYWPFDSLSGRNFN